MFSTLKNTIINSIPDCSLLHWHPPWKSKHILHCNTNIFTHSASNEAPGPTKLDTVSFSVGADVCASATVSQFKQLFTDLQQVEGMFLKGVAGKIPVIAKGTLHLAFEDDEGEIQTFPIRDSFCVPNLQMTLLCPQQWAKQRETDFGWEDGAQFITKGDHSVFKWDKGSKSITVPMDTHTNPTAPGFRGTATWQATQETMVHKECRSKPHWWKKN